VQRITWRAISARPDPSALINALGAEIVQQRAGAGDRAAQFSQGCRLVQEADGGAGTQLGESGRSPKADVRFALCTAQLLSLSPSCDASIWPAVDLII